MSDNAAATEMDQAFVDYVVKAIVDNPDKVKIVRSVDERGVLLELSVDPSDMGKIIGKAGATAKAIRTLLRVLGAKSDARFNLKIVEPEGEQRHEETPSMVEQDSAESPVETDNDNEETDAIRAKAREGLEDLDDLKI